MKSDNTEQTRKEKKEWSNGFICGFTCAVVVDIKNHGMRTETEDLWRCNALSLTVLRKAGVPEDDILVLKSHWKELNRKNRK